MYVIVAIRLKRNQRQGYSYWSGVRWGAKGVAKRYRTVEEATEDEITIPFNTGSQYEYPVGAIIDESKEPNL